MIKHFVILLNMLVLYYFLIISVCYTALLITAMPGIIRRFRELLLGETLGIAESNNIIPITVIIPAYNEEDNIINCVSSVLRSSYKNVKAIVISDGSTDKTIEYLTDTYQLQSIPIDVPPHLKTAKINHLYVSTTHPQLTVIDKEHSGAGDSMNAGINALKTPIFMTVDADSLLEERAIERLAYTMLSEKHTVAVGGGVYILNGCDVSGGIITKHQLPRRYISKIQACEYLRSFVFARTGFNVLRGSLSYSGTSSLLEREAALAVGGFDRNNPAQDAEIIVHLHQYMRENGYPYNILFTPTAFSWTTVPESFRSYSHQRIAWQWGLMRSMLRHIKMFFNPLYGITGLLTYPFFLLVEVLGSLVELLAYLLIILSLIIGIFDLKAAIIFFLLSAGFSAFLTVMTMLMNMITFNKYRKVSDIIRMFFYAIIEMFGFRQYSIVVRTIGLIKYFFVGFKKA